MPSYAACLIDVYETVLSVDFHDHTREIASLARVEPEAFMAAVSPWGDQVSDGRASLRTALGEALRGLDAVTDDAELDRLVARDRELIHELAVLHEDTVPFLEELAARGVRTAFVSNCADNTRPLLDRLGLLDLVDAAVLSCEVGAAKPDPRIYTAALTELRVPAEDAVFVDDQQRFCDGATALGIRSVLIDRSSGTGEIERLTDVTGLFT
ncbi:HAD family hydrolase [Nocardioides coralli]|uniref:HAD family hydrolase n=1 Tax=Nocardioides coralli TaxID=2872154 RepID=UPI001CA38D4B|nr:HAD-IA family hydrolase [Nocardioides coralli]QZY29744.1 HAD-IA family hydrolase [Nocardioides coralli]